MFAAAPVRSEKRSPGITIEDDVWIGANVTLLKGLTIGTGAVVGAGSVVTRTVAPYTIVAGVPAKKLRDRFSPEALERHCKEYKSYAADQRRG